mmetsp:Transcript_5474/g.12033  ORF Transcript_5474/g.12033 Transcript_5474/m.12033 type:complete len:205 (+) Transcript_5474:579-1193(+)
MSEPAKQWQPQVPARHERLHIASKIPWQVGADHGKVQEGGVVRDCEDRAPCTAGPLERGRARRIHPKPTTAEDEGTTPGGTQHPCQEPTTTALPLWPGGPPATEATEASPEGISYGCVDPGWKCGQHEEEEKGNPCDPIAQAPALLFLYQRLVVHVVRGSVGHRLLHAYLEEPKLSEVTHGQRFGIICPGRRHLAPCKDLSLVA